MTPEDVAFYSLLVGFLSTMITLVVKSILRSNCAEVKCLCFNCKRDPEQGLSNTELSTGDLMSTTGPIHVNVDPGRPTLKK